VTSLLFNTQRYIDVTSTLHPYLTPLPYFNTRPGVPTVIQRIEERTEIRLRRCTCRDLDKGIKDMEPSQAMQPFMAIIVDKETIAAVGGVV
jgi:hypothetical protein